MTLNNPHGEGAARPYRQIFLSQDQIDRLTPDSWLYGEPLSWQRVPSLKLACLEIDPDELAERLGISFAQHFCIIDGLGYRPTAILDLPSGLRIGLVLYPTRGWMPHWKYVNVEVDPSSIQRPFVDGFLGEYIIERYRDDLIDEVMAALDLPRELIIWRETPFWDPPLTTPEGLAQLEKVRREAPAPHFEPGHAVQAVSTRAAIKSVEGQQGRVVRRQIRLNHAVRPPTVRGWTYEVAFEEPAFVYSLWEDELESARPPGPAAVAPQR